MNIRRMKIFIALADNPVMSHISHHLCITQPGITRAINELESELSLKLFDRIGKRLHLTGDGKIVYQYFKRIVNLHDELLAEASHITRGDKGSMNIGASTTVGIYILPELINTYNDAKPDIVFNIKISNTLETVGMLKNNEIDMGLIEGPVHDPDMIVVPLWNDELVFITGYTPDFTNGTSLPADYLMDKEMIVREKGSGTREIFENALLAASLELGFHMELGNSEAIKKMINTPKKVSCLSYLTVKYEIAAKKLNYFRVNELRLGRKLQLVYHKDKLFNRNMSDFYDFLRGYDPQSGVEYNK